MTPDADPHALGPIRRRRMAFLLMVLLLPAVLIARPWLKSAGTWLLLGWCGLYAAITLLCVFSRCPRCGHLFHGVRGMDNPFSRACRGCGLTLSSRFERETAP